MTGVVVVGAAIVRGDRLLACRRIGPPALAGRWEFPGGKVERGEDERSALARECFEELALAVTVGERLGSDVSLVGSAPAGGTAVLRVYACAVPAGTEPRLVDHDRVRWLRADELTDVPWIEADLDLVLLAGDLLRSTAVAPGRLRRTTAVVQNPQHGLRPG